MFRFGTYSYACHSRGDDKRAVESSGGWPREMLCLILIRRNVSWCISNLTAEGIYTNVHDMIWSYFTLVFQSPERTVLMTSRSTHMMFDKPTPNTNTSVKHSQSEGNVPTVPRKKGERGYKYEDRKSSGDLNDIENTTSKLLSKSCIAVESTDLLSVDA